VLPLLFHQRREGRTKNRVKKGGRNEGGKRGGGGGGGVGVGDAMTRSSIRDTLFLSPSLELKRVFLVLQVSVTEMLEVCKSL